MPATAQVRIGADTKDFRRAMNGINAQFKKLNKDVGILNKTLGLLGRATKGIGMMGSFVGIPGILGASTRAFMKFEKNVAEVYTLLPKANRAAFDQMSKDALRFSEKFGIMPEEVTRGMYQAISAGITPETLMSDDGFLEVAQQSAVAGVTDLKTAVDAFTNVINSYGRETYDVAQVADMMFKAVSMSKTTFRELSDYMYQILPTAGSLGIRLDDLLGSISALAATGTLTRVGTTQLRQMFIELGRTGDKANEAFLQASGGTPFQQFIRDGGRVTEVIAMIGNVAKSRGTDLRNLFGSVEAGNAAINLFTSRSVQGMIDALDETSGASAGSMSTAFNVMANTVSFQFSRMVRSFMNAFSRLGEVIKPALLDVINLLQRIGQRVSNLPWDEMSRAFKVAWTRIKELVQTGDIWDYLKTGFQLALSSMLAFAGYASAKIYKFISSIAPDSMGFGVFGIKDIFQKLGDLITGLTPLSTSMINAISDKMTEFSGILSSIGNDIENALIRSFQSAQVAIQQIMDDIMEYAMGIPVLGENIAKSYYKSQYKDEDEALNKAQQLPDFNEGLEKGRFQINPFKDDDLNEGRKTFRDSIEDYNNSAFKHNREVSRGSLKEGSTRIIEPVDYEKAVPKEGDIDFSELRKIVENIKILNKGGIYRDTNYPVAFASGAIDDQHRIGGGNLIETFDDMVSATLAAGGRAQIESQQGREQRAENIKTRITEKVTELISPTKESSFLPYKETTQYKLSNNIASESLSDFMDKAGNFQGVVESLTGTLINVGASEKSLKSIGKQWEKLLDDIIGNIVLPDKEDPKYTEGGIPQTPQKEPWALINKSASVVADSLQSIGGGGFWEKSRVKRKEEPEEIRALRAKERFGGVLSKEEKAKLQGVKVKEKPKDKKEKSAETTAIEEQTDRLGGLLEGIKNIFSGLFSDESPEKNEVKKEESNKTSKLKPVSKDLKNASALFTDKQNAIFKGQYLNSVDRGTTKMANIERFNEVIDKHMNLVTRLEDLQERAERSEPAINF
mgnify:CR=1 FL=1